jgi:general stress protein 26
MKHTDPTEFLQKVLTNISYVAVATTCPNGLPWNTPVAAFHFGNDCTLYWASWQENQHSKNIRANGQAFVVAYDSTPADGTPSQGTYMQGRVVELTATQHVMQAALVFKDNPYNPSDGNKYLGTYPRRIYKFTADVIWVNGDDEIDGKFIDIRRQVQGWSSL